MKVQELWDSGGEGRVRELWAVFYLETCHPAILDGYIVIWTDLGGAGSLKNTPFWTDDSENMRKYTA